MTDAMQDMAFKALDSNRDKFIDMNEIKQMSDTGTLAFRMMDANQNDRIEKEEYIKNAIQMMPASMPRDGKMRDMIGMTFNAMDQNRDGALDKREFDMMMNKSQESRGRKARGEPA